MKSIVLLLVLTISASGAQIVINVSGVCTLPPCTLTAAGLGGFGEIGVAEAGIRPGDPPMFQSIHFSASYNVLITGGSGNANFLPVISGSSNGHPSYGSGLVGVDAYVPGTSAIWGATEGCCGTGHFQFSTVNQQPYRFTFGVPFEVDFTEDLSTFVMDTHNNYVQANAFIEYDGPRITDLNGNSISASVGIVEIPSPEPGTMYLLLTGTFLVGTRRICQFG